MEDVADGDLGGSQTTTREIMLSAVENIAGEMKYD